MAWSEARLGDLVVLHTQQVNPAAAPNRVFEHYSIPAFDDGMMPVFEPGSAIKSSKLTVPHGAVLLSKLNPRICRVWAVEPSGRGEAVASTEFLVLRAGADTDRAYLRYVLQSPEFRDALSSRVTGTSGSHQRVQPTTALDLRVPVPPKPTQIRIGAALMALDDKIELNRRMSETLEAIAQAVFQDWIMDPSRSDRTATAWATTQLRKLLTLQYGKSLPKAKHVSGEVPVYGSGGIYGWHDLPLVMHPTVIVGRKGTVGSVRWESRPCHPADTVFYVVPSAPLTFCYYLLQTLGLHTMNTDAAVPGLNRENAYRLEVPDPPEAELVAFNDFAGSIRQRIDLAAAESHALSEIRDTLLPKLISGELRVPDAERLVSEVT